MAKLTKRIVDSAERRSSDYFIWDDDLAGSLAYASSRRASEAILFSTGPLVEHAVTRLVFTAPGRLNSPARKPAFFSGGLRTVRTRLTSVAWTPKPLR
jgi:hypothetical protein